MDIKALGRPVSDRELTAFHGGGTCTIVIHSNGTVTTSGDCKDVEIKTR